MKKNTPELWDAMWEKDFSYEEDLYYLEVEEKSIRFHRMNKIILDHFNTYEGLNVIEVGAGIGPHAAMMAKRGAKVTILDYSTKALERSKQFFERHKLDAEFICVDALNLPEQYFEKYDISMSFGLSEHFIMPDRLTINKTHFDLINSNGITFISVPNKHNPPYRIYKFISQKIGTWKFGEEYPYTRKEFKKICKKLDVKNFFFIGGSIYYSLKLISPISVINKITHKSKNLDITKLKMEKGTCLDKYVSYALVLCAFKS